MTVRKYELFDMVYGNSSAFVSKHSQLEPELCFCEDMCMKEIDVIQKDIDYIRLCQALKIPVVLEEGIEFYLYASFDGSLTLHTGRPLYGDNPDYVALISAAEARLKLWRARLQELQERIDPDLVKKLGLEGLIIEKEATTVEVI